jgi:hypothetical protein
VMRNEKKTTKTNENRKRIRMKIELNWKV